MSADSEMPDLLAALQASIDRARSSEKSTSVRERAAVELRRLADKLERDYGRITVGEATAAMRARADELDPQ